MNRSLITAIITLSVIHFSHLSYGQRDIEVLAKIDETLEYRECKQKGAKLYPSLQRVVDYEAARHPVERLVEVMEHNPKDIPGNLQGWHALNLTDDGSALISLPFPFKFYGETYESIWVNANGNVSFSESNGRYRPESFPLDIPMIAIFWTDLVQLQRKGSGVFVKADKNELKIIWKDMGINNGRINGGFSFELILGKGNLEGPNNLVLNCPEASFARTDSLSFDALESLKYVSGLDSGNGRDYRILELKDRLVYSFLTR